MFKFIEKIGNTLDILLKMDISLGVIFKGQNEKLETINKNLENVIIRLSSSNEEEKMKEEFENEIKQSIKDMFMSAVSQKGNTLTKQEVIALINMIKTNK